MTEIAFHFNAPDKLSYVCRLLRKAIGGQARVVVVGTQEMLDTLDRALWSFAPTAFLAHCRAGDDAMVLRVSPIVLALDHETAPHHQVLVNLGGEVPPSFSRFERLIEIVSRDDAEDRNQARARWKHYADRGYAIVRHDLQLKE